VYIFEYFTPNGGSRRVHRQRNVEHGCGSLVTLSVESLTGTGLGGSSRVVSQQEESEKPLAAAQDAVLVVDDARTLVDANHAATRLLGLSAKQLIGRRFDDFLEPSVDVEAAWQSFLDSGEQTGELRVLRPYGEVRGVEYCATGRLVAGRHLAVFRAVA